jgi:hypothetical protein
MRMRRGTGIVVLLALGGGLLPLVLSRVAHADDAEWGPFSGRVIDVETGAPIAGAAVVLYWVKYVR